jgi:amidase
VRTGGWKYYASCYEKQHVSIKPTSGLVARDNVIVTLLRGTIGPIARTVRGAAIMLSFMAGLSQEDSGTDKIPFTTILDYEKSCKVDGLRNSRLGIPRNALEIPLPRHECEGSNGNF